MSNSAISFNTAGLASTTSPGLVQAGFYNVLPAGLVFPFAGTAVPDGFLECAGQEVSKTTYATLYAALGDTYATQTNPLTGSAWAAPSASNFRLPDYRGSFLRGVGTFTDGVGTDTSLGGYQADAMQGHHHVAASNVAWGTASLGGATYPFAQYFNANSVAGEKLQNNGPVGSGSFSPSNDGTNGNPRTSKETRVRNKGVRYIIKV